MISRFFSEFYPSTNIDKSIEIYQNSIYVMYIDLTNQGYSSKKNSEYTLWADGYFQRIYAVVLFEKRGYTNFV